MDSKIIFLFPSCQRPDKYFATLDNLNEKCITDNWHVLSVFEENDFTMNNDTVKKKLFGYKNVSYHFINSTGKVSAINEGLKYLPGDYSILILIADDIIFTMKGFDSFIISDMQQWFSDYSGCIHYPDGIAKVGDRQITMPVLGKQLIDKWGYIYHPSYTSLWCDNHQLSVLKILNKVKYINREMILHEHPAWQLRAWDDLYKKNEQSYQQDSETYFKHLSNNFEL